MKLIAPDQLRQYGVTLSNKQLSRLEAVGKFPRRVRISHKCHGYVEAEITAHLKKLVAARAEA